MITAFFDRLLEPGMYQCRNRGAWAYVDFVCRHLKSISDIEEMSSLRNVEI